MKYPMFNAAGLVCAGGVWEKRRTEFPISPPPGKGIAWALTQAVDYFNSQCDPGTAHGGVWCEYAGDTRPARRTRP